MTEFFGVKIERNPPQSKLDELRIKTWSKWSRGPSKFDWTFSEAETIYLVAGKAKIKIEEHNESFQIGIGDLVEFPSGMKINMDIIEAVEKYYNR